MINIKIYMYRIINVNGYDVLLNFNLLFEVV